MLSFGEFAVIGFFILSGYLIVQSWDRAPEAWAFLKKRLLRIYPAFLVASLISVLVVGPLAANPTRYFAELPVSNVLLRTLLLKMPIVPNVFQGLHYPLVNGAMWTISREFACYLLVLVLGAPGLLRRRHAWAALTIAAFAVFAWCYARHWDMKEIRLVISFLCGGVFYLYRDVIRLNGKIATLLIAPLALGLCSPALAVPVLVTIGAYILLYAALKHSTILGRFNQAPDVSYGLYLYGWPTQMLLIWYVPNISPWVVFCVASAISIVMGYMSWHMIEKPMMRLKGTAKVSGTNIRSNDDTESIATSNKR